MKNLRRRFDRFCFQNRDKGIPNLILYIGIGSVIVYLISMITSSADIYGILCFNRTAILQGQIWRLFTYAFTYRSTLFGGAGDFLFTLFALYCFFTFGRFAESSMGTLKLNIYFFTGIILQDIFCMITGTSAAIYPLKLSIFLVFATQCPNSNIHLYGIIPIRTWVWVLINFGLTAYEVFALRAFFPHNLFPLIAIINFFLFFGRDFIKIFPMSWRVNAGRLFKKKPGKKTGAVPFPTAGSYQATATKPSAPYTHRCTVCGRTDVSNPELEFRYCSRCQGYYCYCEEHISNHTHIE